MDTAPRGNSPPHGNIRRGRYFDGEMRLPGLTVSTCWSVDDWAHGAAHRNGTLGLLGICDARYQTRSIILTSQMPVARWHEQIRDPTIADGNPIVWFIMRIGSRFADRRSPGNKSAGNKSENAHADWPDDRAGQ